MVLEWLVFRWFYQRMFESMIGLLGLNMMMMFGAVLIWDVHERNIPAPSPALYPWRRHLAHRPARRGADRSRGAAGLLGFHPLHPRRTCHARSRPDVEVAETQGVDTRRTYRIAFFVAILLAALAGALWGRSMRCRHSGRATADDGVHRGDPGGMGSIPRGAGA